MLEHMDQNGWIDIGLLEEQVAPVKVINPLKLIPNCPTNDHACDQYGQECKQTFIQKIWAILFFFVGAIKWLLFFIFLIKVGLLLNLFNFLRTLVIEILLRLLTKSIADSSGLSSTLHFILNFKYL